MPTPRLASIPTSSPEPVFRVTRAGAFAGAWIDASAEVVVGSRELRDGDQVVLVPRGRGAPRLGHVRGGQLFGAAEEPCRAEWWKVVGPVVRIARPARALPPSPVLELPLPLAA